MTTTLDIHQILKLLPHRYPFLLVDRVLDMEKGKRITALKNVTMNEPFFNGHFPHRPVMPGVLMLEAMAQAAALLSFHSLDIVPDDNTVYYFAAIDGARFKRPVEPGDQLTLEVEIERMKAGISKFKGRALVGSRTRLRGDADVRDAPDQLTLPAADDADSFDGDRRPQGRTRRRSVEVGPYAVIGPHVRVGAGTTIGAHCVIEGRTTIGRDNRIFQFASLGARAAGQEIRRRADRAGHRRPQRDPRVLHLQPRRAGRGRRDARGQRQLDHGVHAHRARLPCRQPHHAGQQHHAGRACAPGRLGHGRRAHGHSPVRVDRCPRHARLCQRGHAGRAALHAGRR